jgi:acetolactate decarboxylase
MVRWYHLALGLLAALLVISVAVLIQNINAPPDREIIYQVSAFDLLSSGSYDGLTTAGDLGHHGDFGIGTFQGLNGEMIVLDGTIYQAASDGSVRAVNSSALIPFAVVTYFDADMSVPVNGMNNFSTLTIALDPKLPSKNVFYAIRIHDTFPYMKVRSPPIQQKPYPPLAEALKGQSVFELHNVTGTIVGIYSPAYSKGVEYPGYHFHFISDDRTEGGHVLDLTAKDVNVTLDATPGFYMALAHA